MRLVEAVPGEVLHEVEDLCGLLLVDPLRLCAGHERFALFGHDPGVLLSHGLAEDVGLAHRKASQLRRDSHDLFLVRDDPVRVGQDRRQHRQLVLDLGLPLLAGDEVVHHSALERPWPIERIERNEIVEALGLGFAEQVAHARALELEDAVRLAIAEELVGLAIVERDGIDVDVDVLRYA